jgi:Tfp pilus assembly protein PilF
MALAMVQAVTAAAADTVTPRPCVLALSVSDIERGLRFDSGCDLAPRRLAQFVADAERAARRARLTGRQRVAFAQAADLIFAAASPDAFDHVAPLVLALPAQATTRPDLDLSALARTWIERLALLRRQMRVMRTDDPLEAQVAAATAELDLEAAAKLLAAELAEPDAPDALTAVRSFEAGLVEWLRFSPTRALTFVRIAHALQPNDVDIAELYGDLLAEAHLYEQAQPVVEALALRYQALAQDKPDRWRPRLARELSRLGRLYAALALPQDAEMADLHALGISWGLAREQPDRFGPEVADLLAALGALYRDVERPDDAIDAYREALKLERALAQRDAATYTAGLATTLNDLGVLYAMTHRSEEAQHAYAEALDLQRALVREHPLANRAALARTLNNLGNFYSDGERFDDAELAYGEALAIRRQLARESPAQDAPDLARTLTNLGVLYRKEGRVPLAEHAYREALRMLSRLDRAARGAFSADQARVLNNLGVLLSKTRRQYEAEDAYRRSVALYASVAKKEPAAYRGDYARVLANLAKLYADMGRKREAQAVQAKEAAQSKPHSPEASP